MVVEQIGEKELAFLKNKFREYYSRGALSPPSDLTAREYGFGWRDKIELRHKSFASARELADYFARNAPLYASHSVAHYAFPDAPMEKKGARAWDLVFDIDSPSREVPHSHDPILCMQCFARVRADTLRLVEEFLCGDFGFARDEVSVNYSGGKGFHVHVESRAVNELSSDSRKQLLEYVAGPPVDRVLLEEKRGIWRGPGETARGWGGKVFGAARDFLEKASAEDVRAFGIRSDQAKKIVENKEFIAGKLAEGNWSSFAGLEKIWRQLVPDAIAAHGVRVDRAVTFDSSKLIRLPESLHGDTGFAAKKIGASELAGFNPFEQAVAFKGKNLVRVKSLQLLETVFLGERAIVREGENELREGLAILLLCKKKAVLA